ncbi:MAG: hypothetical protein RL719_1111, partial [Actinomycetota bacterium]
MFKKFQPLVAIFTAFALFFSIQTSPAFATASLTRSVSFLKSKFVGGQFIEGFTPGKPDWGFSVEAMLQLKGAGVTNASQSKALSYNLTSATNLGTTEKAVGFLYAPDRTLLPGRAGEFVFAANVFAVTNTLIYRSTLASLKSQLASTGVIGKGNSNTFTYGWVALGLAAAKETKLANAVANQLAALARPDGGFGTDLTGDTATSAPDATGIALLGLKATENLGSASEKSKRAAAAVAAINWLNQNAIGDHFESWGDIDVNGTAYAVMGLSAWARSATKFVKYLNSRVAGDGGLTTPWSNGKGDTYATAQGLLALSG